MLRAVFIFGLCLTLVGVAMGNYFAWIPETVPTPAQQCIDLRHEGICTNGVPLASPDICGGVLCAHKVLPADRVHVARPISVQDGTICGVSNACKKQACTRVPIANFPRQVGSTVSFPCQVGDPDSDKENVEPPNPNRQGAQSLSTVPLK